MNATVFRTTDAELELNKLASIDEGYETTPILAIAPLPQRPDEEELHTLFEKALDERLTGFGSCLNRLRDSVAYTEAPKWTLFSSRQARPTTEPLSQLSIAKICPVYRDQTYSLQRQTKHRFLSIFLKTSTQRAIIYFCCALSFMLLGFDLMGLLVLYRN